MGERASGHGPHSESLERRTLLASAGTLLTQDFTGTAWQQTPGALSGGVTATLEKGGYGTVDVAGGTTTSGALRLTVNTAPAAPWTADLTSGPLAIANTETNLGKLTLAFSLNASQAKPVRVIVSSYDSGGAKTGALATTVAPAVAYSYQRFAVDLSTMQTTGSGTFNPTAPKISFDFEMASDNGWSTATAAQLRLDNVHYAKPSYYVNSALPSTGTHNGLTEATAFLTPQAALNVAQPGDIIAVMNGTYTNTGTSTNKISFTKGGSAAAWVTLKNYPGQSPIIRSEHWNAISIGGGSKTAPATGAAIAYVEVRGLHVIGDSAKVGSRSAPDGPYDPTAPNADQYGPYAQYIGAVDGRTNGNGITADGRYETNKPHDIRFADNIVEQCAGGGIGGQEVDRIQIENNVVRDNCYWDIYATSGISVLSRFSFDGTSGTTTRLVRNNVTSGNIHKEKWTAIGKYSDGNGIIIDLNFTTADEVEDGATYVEVDDRTLVTNNLSYDNGGSGVHAFGANHVDIVNNTAYNNSASPYLQYAPIFAGSTNTPGSGKDINVLNNIAVQRVANLAAGEASEPVSGGLVPTAANAIVYKNNVYFGGNTAARANNAYNVNNVTADPRFINASTNPAVANFGIKASSPAVNKGLATLAPVYDLAGLLRSGNPDAGAYEFDPTAPMLAGVVSRKTHGTAGTFDLALNLSGTPTIEPRAGGGSTLVWTFSEPVIAADGVLDASEFGLTNAAFASAVLSGATLTLELTGVVNGKTASVLLAGLTDVAGNAVGGVSGVSVGNLYGDVNANRAVNAGDVSIIKNASGSDVTIASFLFDLNANGSINAGDVSIVKSLSGDVLA